MMIMMIVMVIIWWWYWWLSSDNYLDSGLGNSSTFLPTGSTQWESGPGLPVRWILVMIMLKWWCCDCNNSDDGVNVMVMIVNMMARMVIMWWWWVMQNISDITSGCLTVAAWRYQIISYSSLVLTTQDSRLVRYQLHSMYGIRWRDTGVGIEPFEFDLDIMATVD